MAVSFLISIGKNSTLSRAPKVCKGSSLSWFLFLRAAELLYFVKDDEFDTVLYSPQRVMRQFGFDQHRPFGHSCHRDYESALDNFSLYLARLFGNFQDYRLLTMILSPLSFLMLFERDAILLASATFDLSISKCGKIIP